MTSKPMRGKMTTNQTWEERFDEMAEGLCVWFDSDGEDEVNVYLDQLYELDEIKSFIQAELQRQRESIVEEIRRYFTTKYFNSTNEEAAISMMFVKNTIRKELDDIIKKVGGE
jgi:hypothetical protein